MSLLLYGNFDAEHEWADPNRRALPGLQRLHAELSTCWCALATAGDAVWLPSGGGIADRAPGFAEHLADVGLAPLKFIEERPEPGRFETLWPWGWTGSGVRLAEQLDLPFAAPSVDVVRRANSRLLADEIERALGVGLPGARVLEGPGGLAEALAGLPAWCDRWVVKAEFGMSARERFIGVGRAPIDEAFHWIRRRTKGEGRVVFEPWVDRVAEAGIQFTVRPPAVGPPVLEGVTPLLVDDFGRYRGSRFGIDPETEVAWSDAINVGMRVATRLAGLGYFGPLGVDACRFRDGDGLVRSRPVQDVNARFTMGSLALGLRRLLRPGEHGTWCHVRWGGVPETWFAALLSRLPPGVRAVRTAPFVLDDLPVSHGTLALVGPSAEALAAAERVVFRSPGASGWEA